MILRELYELYGRLVAAGEEVPQMGRSRLPVSFRIVLTPEGSLVRIEDARMPGNPENRKGKGKPVPVSRLVPYAKGRTSGVCAYFLCDKAEYLLGYGKKAAGKFSSSVSKHLSVERLVNSPLYAAVCRFLENWNPDEITRYIQDGQIYSDLTESAVGVFRIQGHLQDVHECEEISRWWDESGSAIWWDAAASSVSVGRCLISNEIAPIARLHEPSFSGLGDKKTMLVSFNHEAFKSYGCKNNDNAPVSVSAAFAYCNALNYLISSSSNRVRLGESTIVFWTDAPKKQASAMEMFTRLAMNPEPPKAQDGILLKAVWDSLGAMVHGKIPANTLELPQKSRFFILGLSPNSARLSVRFYQESTFGEFLQHLREHYEGLSLVRRGEAFKDPDVISPFMILRESVRDISKELPAATIGHLMNAILSGSPYPDMLAMSILRRFKADGNINYIRCAFLKAWLIRNHHLNITTMLDTNNTQPGYLLGRLFAILVKTQEDALGKNLNRTLRDSYYSSASATPRVVFPRLMRLFQHHLSKLEGGLKTARDKQVQEVMWLLGTEYPVHLTLAAQGSFALGYYHQTQSFYTKKTMNETPEKTQLQQSTFNI